MFTGRNSKRQTTREKKRAKADGHAARTVLIGPGPECDAEGLLGEFKLREYLARPETLALYEAQRHRPPSELLGLLGPEALLILPIMQQIAWRMERLAHLHEQGNSSRSDAEIYRGAKRKAFILVGRGKVEEIPLEAAEKGLVSTGDLRSEIRLLQEELRAIAGYFSKAAAAKVNLARPLRPLLTLHRFEELRAAGKSEKEAVAEIAGADGRTLSAVRADIQHARERLEARKIPFRPRGPRI